MGIRDQVKRAIYGVAIGADEAAEIGLPVLAANDTDISAANSTLIKALRPYILQKHYVAGGRFRSFWYFGQATKPSGEVIPGCNGLTDYPLRIYDDAGNGGYGGLVLGTQGAVGRMVVTSARANLVTTISNTNSVGTGISTGSHSDFSVGTAKLTDATWAVLTTTKGNIIASTASDQTLFAGTALAHSSANTVITDSTGGTASTTFAALTATVTSTVAANAIAQLAANENRRLGLMGIVVDGTTTAQPLYLNWIIDDADQAATADNNLVGEIKLRGVIEISGELQGDI